MDSNKMMEQVTAIFSIFMVLFYLGVGIYLIFYFNKSYMVKELRIIMGSTFIFYGLYRAFRTYTKIVELFFTHQNDDE